MGKKKWCFGREDVICLTKDCPYMSDCIKVVWQKKMDRLMDQGQADRARTMPKLKSTLKERERKRVKAHAESKTKTTRTT